MDTDESAVFVVFNVKYAKSVLTVRLPSSDTLADLKAILFSLSDVPPERQKLIGLTRAKLPPDETSIEALAPFPPASTRGGKSENGETQVAFMLVGTPVAMTFQDPTGKQLLTGDAAPEQVDVDYTEAPAKAQKEPALPPAQDPVNLAKLEKAISRFSDFSLIHEPRPGKGLLVLDLDYTLADTKRLLAPASLASEAARPGLHAFLRDVYPFYDICVWSQTSWRWLETKLTELNMLASPDVNRITFVLDRTPMFSITTPSRKHEVKPLELIWRRFPGWNRTNTVHVDDLSRNFAMNPNNGVKIKPYKNSPNFDTELSALTKYCRQLALVPDVSQLTHKHWKHFVGPEANAASAAATTLASAAATSASGAGPSLATQPIEANVTVSVPSGDGEAPKQETNGSSTSQSEDQSGT